MIRKTIGYLGSLLIAGTATVAIAAAPLAGASPGFSPIPQEPGGSGCAYGVCGSGDASGGQGCTADGVCGHGGPNGGGGCVPGVGCFNWGQ